MQVLPLLLALVLVPACAAGSLKHVRSIALSDYVRPTGAYGADAVRVRSLAFSGDGRWLAAAVSAIGSGRLLVVSVEPRAEALRYSARIPLMQARRGGFGRTVWSPDGKALAVGTNPPVVLDLERDTMCELKASSAADVLLGGFTSPRDLAGAEMSNGTWRLVIYGLDCKAVQYRDVGDPVVAIDASERGRVAVSTANRVSLYDTSSGSLVKSWRRPSERRCSFSRAARWFVKPDLRHATEPNRNAGR